MSRLNDSTRKELIDGKEHLVKDGVFGKEDLGELHEHWDGTKSTNHVFGENFTVSEDKGILSSPGYHVSSSSGEEGDVEPSSSVFPFGRETNYHSSSPSSSPSHSSDDDDEPYRYEPTGGSGGSSGNDEPEEKKGSALGRVVGTAAFLLIMGALAGGKK